MRVARVDKIEHQEELVDALVTGASNRDIRQRIDEFKGTPKTAANESSSSTPKPKKIYHTTHRATVIVQGETSRLTNADTIAALKEALGKASVVS
jgi:hypothetical protein